MRSEIANTHNLGVLGKDGQKDLFMKIRNVIAKRKQVSSYFVFHIYGECALYMCKKSWSKQMEISLK